ncbi:MAG: tetratricopeptide repeat protein [Planctomycetota bacterium]|nr:tetratricopeptide repeat protein [Planctomycetota bacterium]
MNPLLAALALLLPPSAPAPVQGTPTEAAPAAVDAKADVYGSPLQVSFSAVGWERDARLETKLSEQFGLRTIAAGRFHGASLTIHFQPDEPPQSSSAWRDQTSTGTPFEVGGIACAVQEQRLPGDGRAMVRYSAFALADGRVFELHVAAPRSPEGETCSHEQFEDLVRSWRVQVVRFGKAQELPEAARDCMARALAAGAQGFEQLERELAKPGEDKRLAAAQAFAFAELLHLTAKAPQQRHEAHVRAAERLAALPEPDEKLRHALALSEYGAGVAALALGKKEEARERLGRAVELAGKHVLQRDAKYELAVALATLGKNEEALALLTEVVGLDGRLRARAEHDRRLDALSADPRFTELVQPRR